MKKSRAAFTLAELLVAAAVSTVIASVIYTLGSDALFAFARNMSTNRCYSEARAAMDRISSLVQSAGHTPVLVNEDGTAWSSSTLPSTSKATQEAPGVRFYRLASQPSYAITSCASSGSTMTVTLPSGADAPKVGDVVLIGAVGFQGIVSSVTGSGTSYTLKFTDMNGVSQTIGILCNPDITTATDITASQNYCLIFNRVGFIAVSTPALASPAAAPSASNISIATATELRYYPNFNDLTTYKVIGHLVIDQSDSEESYIQRPRPFQINASPAVSVTLNDLALDYTNRTRNISYATMYTQVQSSFGARSPRLLSQGPF